MGCGGSESKGTTATGSGSTGNWSSTTGRSSHTERSLARSWRSRRAATHSTFGWSSSETTGNARLKLACGTPDMLRRPWRAQIDSRATVAIAKQSEVAIVVAGIEEGEFRDRAKLGLPGHQEELISRRCRQRESQQSWCSSAAVRSRCRHGSIPCRGAVIDAWYPGEQGGRGGGRCAVPRLRDPGGTIADHVSNQRGPGPTALQPQADGAWRRLPRPHRAAALSIRIRAQLHDIRVFGACDRP